MPANVESMFSVRQMPWHREGTVLADYPGDWDEARKLAGLDWDPITTEVYAVTGLNADGTPHLRADRRAGSPSPAPTTAPSCRSTATPTPSSTTARWARSSKPSSPSPTSNGKPQASWTAAVPSGAWPCSMSRSPCPATTAPRCPTWPSPTGTTAPPPARCAPPPSGSSAPTPSAPPNSKASAPAPPSPSSTKPTGATASSEARQAVTGAQAEMRRYAELARELLAIPVTPAQRELFITQFIPKPPDGLITDRVARNVDEARSALRLLFDTTHHRPGRRNRLRAGAGRRGVPRSRPHRAVLGNQAQPDPDPARAAQAPGTCNWPGMSSPRPKTPVPGLGECHPPARPATTLPLPREKQRSVRHVQRYQPPARPRSPRLAARPHRPARTLRAVRPARHLPVPRQGRALPQRLRRSVDHRTRLATPQTRARLIAQHTPQPGAAS